MEYANSASGPLFELAKIVAHTWGPTARIEPFYAAGATVSEGYQIIPNTDIMYVCCLSGQVTADMIMRLEFGEDVAVAFEGTGYFAFYGINLPPGKGASLIGYRLTRR
jgi:hypothetical protein